MNNNALIGEGRLRHHVKRVSPARRAPLQGAVVEVRVLGSSRTRIDIGVLT